jgi:hypothetical protein
VDAVCVFLWFRYFLADRIWQAQSTSHVCETVKHFLLICQLSCQAITEASHALNGSSLLRLCRLVRLVRIIKALLYPRLHTEFDLESSCSNGLANMSPHMCLFHSLSSGLLITVDHGETEFKVFLDGHSRRCLDFARLSA